MKTIKVFLASSEELKEERLEFADLVLQLNKLFKPRQLELELEKWEHLDASMGVKHKQEEYNDKLKECELCLTLYWNKFGEYTAEELETAYKELKEGRNPRKLYVFFKNPTEITPELQQFKESFATNYGHFFCKFENVDTMRLQFLLQLETYQNHTDKKLLEVKNQKILVEGTPVVDLNNVPFAAMNKEFVRLRDGLEACNNEITQFEAILAQMKNPAIEAMLNAKKAERNKMHEEFDVIQSTLLNTAIKVAKLKGKEYDELLQRAINDFEHGNLEGAHARLQEASLKVAQERQAYKLKKESLAADRSNLVSRIKQLLLDAEAVIGVESYTFEERIEKADFAYNEALLTALEIDYDKEQYASLVFDYAVFAHLYGKYDKAEELYLEHVDICEKVFGTEHPDTATSYNNIGLVYNSLGDYPKALEYYKKAVAIREKVLGTEHQDTAASYNNIGSFYRHQGDYPKALEYYENELLITEKVFGTEHPFTATSYKDIGLVYKSQGNYSKTLEYYENGLAITEKVFGTEHLMTSQSYYEIGSLYMHQDNYPKALEYYEKELLIKEKVFGAKHRFTTTSYTKIREAYYNQGNAYYYEEKYSEAIESFLKMIEIEESVFGDNYIDLVDSYNSIANAYCMVEDYETALLYFRKELDTRLKSSNEDSIELAICYASIGYLTSDNKERHKFHNKALEIRLKVLGKEDLDTAQSYFDVANAYIDLSEFQKSIKYFNKALNIRIKLLGIDNEDVAACYNNIGYNYNEIGKYQEALKADLKSLAIREKVLGVEDSQTAMSYHHLGKTYNYLGQYTTALEWLNKALPIRERELGKDNEWTKATCEQIEIAKLKLNTHNEEHNNSTNQVTKTPKQSGFSKFLKIFKK